MLPKYSPAFTCEVIFASIDWARLILFSINLLVARQYFIVASVLSISFKRGESLASSCIVFSIAVPVSSESAFCFSSRKVWFSSVSFTSKRVACLTARYASDSITADSLYTSSGESVVKGFCSIS